MNTPKKVNIVAHRNHVLNTVRDKTKFKNTTWSIFIEQAVRGYTTECGKPNAVTDYPLVSKEDALMEFFAIALHCEDNQEQFNQAIADKIANGIPHREAGIEYLKNKFIDSAVCLAYLCNRLEQVSASNSIYIMEKYINMFLLLPDERPHNKYLFYKGILEASNTLLPTPNLPSFTQEQVKRKLHQIATHVVVNGSIYPQERGLVNYDLNSDKVISANVSNIPYNVMYMSCMILPRKNHIDFLKNQPTVISDNKYKLQQWHDQRENLVLYFEVVEDTRSDNPRRATLYYVLNHAGMKHLGILKEAVTHYATMYYDMIYANNDGISNASGKIEHSLLMTQLLPKIQRMLDANEKKPAPAGRR